MKRYLAMLLCCLTIITLVSCGTPAPEPGPFDIDGSDTLGDASDKTELNYLTGEYNMAQDRVGKKPYCIPINNLDTNWPQAGTSQADILMEMEIADGVTRLMGVYSDSRELEKIGTVPSLHDQFIKAVASLDPIIVHIGTSIYADKALAAHGMATIDANNQTDAVFIDPDRVEDTYFTSGNLIQDALTKTNMSEDATNRSSETFFNFAKGGETVIPGSGAASAVKFNFSANESYDGDFRYDEASGNYLKFQRGQAQIDANNNTQLAFKNVLVLMADTTVINPTGLVNVNYQAGGKGYYFSGGRYEEINWVKPGFDIDTDVTSVYIDSSGGQIDSFSLTLKKFDTNFTITKADGSALVLNTGKTMLCVANSSYSKSMAIAG